MYSVRDHILFMIYPNLIFVRYKSFSNTKTEGTQLAATAATFSLTIFASYQYLQCLCVHLYVTPDFFF